MCWAVFCIFCVFQGGYNKLIFSHNTSSNRSRDDNKNSSNNNDNDNSKDNNNDEDKVAAIKIEVYKTKHLFFF